MKALFLTFLIGVNAFAGPAEDKALEESLKTGATIGSQEIGRQYLNSLPGLENGARLGDKMVLGLGAFLSIKNLINAHNESEGALALSNGGISVLSYLNAGAGLVIGVAWFGMQIISNFFAAQNTKALLETYRRIAEYYKQVAEIDTKLAESEFMIIEQAYHRIDSMDRDLKNSSDYTRDYCLQKDQVNTVDGFLHCVELSEQMRTDMQILVGQAKVILNFKSDVLDVDKLFGKLNISKEQFAKLIDDASRALAKQDAKVDQLKSHYVGLINQIMEARALQQSAASELRDGCIQKAIDLRTTSLEIRINRATAGKLEKVSINNVTLGPLFTTMSDFATGECATLSEKSNDPQLQKLMSRYFEEFGKFKREMSI